VSRRLSSTRKTPPAAAAPGLLPLGALAAGFGLFNPTAMAQTPPPPAPASAASAATG